MLTYPFGSRRQYVTVTVKGHSTSEPDKVLIVQLTDPTNAKLTGDGQVKAIILGDRAPRWLAERGLATLDLRIQAACANAARLADWLAEQPGVSRVLYPGRPDHPDHALAKRVLKGGFGSTRTSRYVFAKRLALRGVGTNALSSWMNVSSSSLISSF